MNTEPPTGDDLQRMLVAMKQNVLEGAIAAPRKKARRNWALGIGIVAFLGLGAASGGVALGLVPSPFTASAPAPAVTSAAPAPQPTATTPPAPDPKPTATLAAGPRSTVPITCGALFDEADLKQVDPELSIVVPTSVDPVTASVKIGGVLNCSTSTDGQGTGTSLNLAIISDPAAAEEELSRWTHVDGSARIDIGDRGYVSCDGAYADCTATFVSGDFWVVATFSSAAQPTTLPGSVTSALQRVASTLAPLTPVPAWTPPASIWTDITTCEALRTATPINEILGTATVGQPFNTGTDGGDTISNQHLSLLCYWQASTPGVVQDEYMTADLSIGGAGQLDDLARAGKAGTPIKVEGADAAYWTCEASEYTGCWIDVQTDGSWLRVGRGSSTAEADLGKLVRVAASLIAGQKG